jgi:hypothetical protein
VKGYSSGLEIQNEFEYGGPEDGRSLPGVAPGFGCYITNGNESPEKN